MLSKSALQIGLRMHTFFRIKITSVEFSSLKKTTFMVDETEKIFYHSLMFRYLKYLNRYYENVSLYWHKDSLKFANYIVKQFRIVKNRCLNFYKVKASCYKFWRGNSVMEF